MSTLYNLKILTPEREFFDGAVEAVMITAPDGKLTVLAGHAPLISPVEVGNISIKLDGVWKETFNSEGFMEVHHEGALIFVQACEWPEEIDVRRAEEARIRAEEQLRQKQSMSQYRQSKIALARAMARLKVTTIRK